MNSDFGADIFDPGAPADPPAPPDSPDDSGDSRRPRKRRTRKAKAASDDGPSGTDAEPRSAATDEPPTPTDDPVSTDAATAESADEEVRLSSKRKRRPRSKAAPADADAVPTEAPAEADSPHAEAVADSPAEPPEDEPAAPPKRKRRPRRRSSPAVGDGDAGSSESTPEAPVAKPETSADRDPNPAADESRDSDPEGDRTDSDRVDLDRDGDRDESRDRDRSRRRGRRGRRRREDEDGGRDERPAGTAEAPTTKGRDESAMRPALPTAAPATQRVVVLLDLEHLAEATTTREIELSYARVLRALVGPRPLLRAVGYGSADTQPPAGIGSELEWRRCAEPESIPVAIAVDALALADRMDCVVLGGGGTQLAPLAEALRARGIRVESAGFEPSTPLGSQHHHVIGRECTFRP